MDERIYDEFGAKKRPMHTEDVPKRSSSAKGEFKLSIDFDAIEKREAQQAKSRTQSNYSNSNDFKVSIPNNVNSERVPVRKASETVKKDTSVKRSASSAVPKKTNSVSKKKGSAASEKKATSQTKPKLTAAQIAKAKELKKYNRTRTILITCVCLLFIAITTTVLSVVAIQTIDDILSIKDTSGETVSVVIEDGASFDEVYDAICDAGLVKQKALVKFFCSKVRSYEKYYSSSKSEYVYVEYEPGVYYFDPDDGIETMLEQIKVSSTVSKDTVRITFPEGWTIAQIFEKIEKYNVCTAEKLYANLDIVGKQFEFYSDIADNSNRYLKAEGYLFPDTYDFYIGESANSVLKKLFNNFNNKWTKTFDDRAKELGMTQDEVIILASIIESEAKGESQMGGVSSVLHNRLKNSATYPLLQMNSTKDYIESIKEYDLFNDYYYSLYLESYNTYSSTGLPPGAICNPGLDAIKAALYPDDTNYNFFCHDKEGIIYYAVTAAEHQKNIQRNLYD